MSADLENGERVVPGAGSTEYERFLYARHVAAYTLAAAAVGTADRVLELGCGEGYGSALLAARAAEVTAADNNAAAIGHARLKYPRKNLSFLVSTPGPLPFPPDSFDKAVCFQVLEHIEDDAFFLAELRRVLKPGGALYLTTPNRALRCKPGARPWYKFHVREYDRADLQALFDRAFPGARVVFLAAPESVFRAEMALVKAAQLAQALDPLDLRQHVPYALKRLVFLLLGFFRGTPPAGAESPEAITGFEVSEEGSRGLDLLVIANK